MVLNMTVIEKSNCDDLYVIALLCIFIKLIGNNKFGIINNKKNTIKNEQIYILVFIIDTKFNYEQV